MIQLRFSKKLFLSPAAVAFVLSVASASAATQSVQPSSASAMLDSIGINIHLGSNSYIGMGDDAYDNFSNVQKCLSYLGITHVRDSIAYDYYLNEVDTLGASGIKFNFYMGTGPYVDYAQEIANLSSRASIIDAVEGPNEVDNFGAFYDGLTGNPAAIAEQKALYAAVHNSPTLNGAGHTTPVYDLTVADPASWANLGNLAPYADYQSVHAYPALDAGPGAWVDAWIQRNLSVAPGRPIVLTEAGYSTLPDASRQVSVSETVQAVDILDLALDAQANHVSRTYLYELLDDHSDPGGLDREQHYGMFHSDGTPKASAVALHNLFSILKDTGSPTAAIPLSFDLTGLPATARQSLMEKSDGTYFLAVWNEQPNWNNSTVAEVQVTPVPVALNLGDTVKAVKVYDPLTGSTAVTTAADTRHVDLQLPGHAVIIEIDPVSASSSSSPSPVPPTVGSGADTLVLTMSEDAYQGDAQFTVAFDGVQLGGTLTAAGSHAAAQSQAFSFKGNFAAGAHDVAVTFLNDAWGGSASTDRNLYVDGAVFNGVSPAGVPVELARDGTVHLAATKAAPSSLPVPPTVGSGPDTFVLSMSEDAYQGDAQFSVTIDGAVVGPVQTAAANHSAGQTQAFSYAGYYGPGPHSVGVSFLNDAWDGTAATDRNLYVDGVTYDGQPATPGAVEQASNGTAYVAIAAALTSGH